MSSRVVRMLRWAALAVAGVALTLVTAAAPVTAASHPDGSVRVLQMNLCASGFAHCYTGRSVTEASQVIRVEIPDVVTVNEVCQDDVATLEDALDTARSGTAVSAFQPVWDRRTGAALRCRNGRPYGIALVARLPRTTRGYEAVGATFPMQDTGSAELRAWLCLGPRAAATAAVAVCTTHLASGSSAVARAQCAYLLGTAIPAVRARAPSSPLILGGDLNLRSDDRLEGHCLPAADRRADDGHVQHVVATPGLAVGPPRTIAMPATDHPGLLVTLTADPGQ